MGNLDIQVQYKKDCAEFYGKMLDNKHAVSSLQAKGKSRDQTMDMWTKLFPEEPFDLNFTSTLSEININKDSEDAKNITYDLVSAVKRQSSFYYQVIRICALYKVQCFKGCLIFHLHS